MPGKGVGEIGGLLAIPGSGFATGGVGCFTTPGKDPLGVGGIGGIVVFGDSGLAVSLSFFSSFLDSITLSFDFLNFLRQREEKVSTFTLFYFSGSSGMPIPNSFSCSTAIFSSSLLFKT